MALTPEQRAEEQSWAIKVQTLENQLEPVKDICRNYLEGMLTAEDCINQIVLKLFS